MYKEWKNWQSKILLEIELGFKDWIYYIKESISSGKSFEQAMICCRDEFYKVIGNRHAFRCALEQLNRGVDLHIPVEAGIRRLGEETGIEVIIAFSTVFEIVRKQGGRMAVTLEQTIQQIHARIELRQEILAMIQAKKLEQRIMCIMPFAILLFVGRASGGYFTPLYHNPKGVFIMTICLAVYMLGFGWGEKLTEVSI